ncbi:MAG TPA: tetratricopeptide repeat protein [Tepidisphaeraceae bacterium]|jgi:predicted TPR repeat methyltransferase|nr:tetratricopeptide repeat protein [Tepidisphaeraceae bacterium]
MDGISTAQSMQIAVRHQQAGRLAEARAIYLDVLAREPNQPDALHLLGVIAVQTGRTDEAIDLIRRAIAINPAVADYHNNLGYALRNQGELDEAIAAWRQAIRLRPEFAEAHNNLGNALRNKGELNEAIAACREALRIKPDSARAYNNLGAALFAKGSFDEAVAAYRRALQLQPELAEIHSNLGNALRGQDQFDEAIASYREAIRLSPELAEAHYNMGVALQCKGQLDEAIVAYRRAVGFKPDYTEAHYNMGIALQRKGQINEAVVEFREAIRLKPDSPEWRYQLAAVSGDRSVKTAPARFVQDLFDTYASTFDKHLVETLKYQTPQFILKSVLEATSRRDLDVLDLGCGTGLCGVEFRPHARRMIGVDLSPAMLKVAESRKIYDRLIEGDLMPALRAAEDGYDLIVAGDLLIYVGDLSEFMPAVAQALRSGGLFACSIEDYDGTGFFLHSQGRFAHSIGYFRELAMASGLKEISAKKVALRQNMGLEVSGWIVVVGRP